MDRNIKTRFLKIAETFNLKELEDPGFKEKIKTSLTKHNSKNISDTDIFNVLLSIINGYYFTPINMIETIFTEQCNFNCNYCFIKRKSESSFNSETAIQTLNFLVLYSGNQKNLYYTLLGGEPLLNFENILNVISYSKKINSETGKVIHFDITTNGSLLNETILQKSNGRLKYLLSIDGNKESHDKHRKLNKAGSFETVISKIQLLKKYQPWLGARMTICPDTVSKLSYNVKFLYNSGINQFILGVCYGPKWDEKSLSIYEEELTKVSEYYLKRIKNNDRFRITYFEKEENNNECLNGIWGCRAGRNSVTVLPNGNIYPCSKFVGLESFECNEFCLGNIYEGITNLTAREKLFNMQSSDFKICSTCDEINSCVGGCPAENYNQNRSVYIPCKDQCEITKIQNRVLRKFWAEQEKATEKMAT